MMKRLKLLFSVLLMSLMALVSCKKDNPEGEGYLITFTPDRYTIGASGGEVFTTVPDHEFKLNFSSTVPQGMSATYYWANKSGDLIETDFFTAERTADYRIKITVQPNTTGKERTYLIEVKSGVDGRGIIRLTQMAE